MQGNLDPSALFAPPERVRAEARRVLDAFGAAPGHVFNLGHGIAPQTPVESVAALVDEVLRQVSGNRLVAARWLGLARATVRKMIRKYHPDSAEPDGED